MALQTVSTGMTTGFAELLNANFEFLQALAEQAEAVLATAVLRLHGEGAETGCGLVAGTGLWVEVGESGEELACWIGGRRYSLETAPLAAVLPASSTSYIYATLSESDALQLEVRSTKVLPTPDGEWYLGSAVTDADSCTSVDDSEMETVNAESILATVQAMQEDVTSLQAALTALSARVLSLETTGPGGDAVLWGTLAKSATDTTTVDQQIDADLQEHLNDYHNGGPGLDPTVEYVITEYDADASNLARTGLLVCRTLQPALFQYWTDCAWVVWGVSGDGTDGIDHVDRVNSTWMVT